MKSLFCLLLVGSLLLYEAADLNCKSFEDHYITWQTQPSNKTKIGVGLTPNVNMYNFAFIYSNTISESVLIISMYKNSNGTFIFKEMSDHTNRQFKIKNTIISQTNLADSVLIEDAYHISFEVDASLFSNYSRFVLIEDSAVAPVNLTTHQTIMNFGPITLTSGAEECDVVGVLRLSDLHWSLIIVEFIFFSGVLILTLIFFNEQPLKSRSCVPTMVVLAEMGSILSAIKSYSTFEFQSKYSCILHTFLYENFIQISFILMPWTYFRYIIIVNLLNQKSKLKNISPFTLKCIQTINFIVSPIFTIIISVVLFIILSIYNTIILSISNFKCPGNIIDYFTYSYFSFKMGCFVVLFVLLFIDIIINLVYFIKTKKSIFQFFHQDVYYFRFEQFFSFFTMTFIILSLIFLTLKESSTAAGNRKLYKTMHTIFENIFHYFFMTYQCLFILIATIGRKIFSLFRNKHTVSKDVLKKELEDENIAEIFHTFAKNEWSEENFLAYTDIQSYKEMVKKTKHELIEDLNVERLISSYNLSIVVGKEKTMTKELKVGQIFHLYLNGSKSPCEINIDRKTVNILKEEINNSAALLENLFDKVEDAVKVNLSDTYSRFIVSAPYLSYKTSLAIVEKQM
eukprot:gene7152-11465_t